MKKHIFSPLIKCTLIYFIPFFVHFEVRILLYRFFLCTLRSFIFTSLRSNLEIGLYENTCHYNKTNCPGRIYSYYTKIIFLFLMIIIVAPTIANRTEDTPENGFCGYYMALKKKKSYADYIKVGNTCHI